MTKKLKKAFTLAGGQSPLLNLDFRKTAFTLAEVLITLSIIGVVAALTIPGVVKHHNEKAWATGQDLFIKKLEVALRAMNTDGKLSGYTTTADFVNELKKNIKINQVCTDDVTKCFAKTITWGIYKPATATINNNSVTYSTRNGQDWAETVGVRFSNGVNALIAYNKNCAEDPYNNQYSPGANCIGIIYDIQANKKPNTYGKDININANIARINGQGLCVYELSDGTCFSKILGPRNGGYNALPNAECMQAKNSGKIDVDYCYNENDYYAGAVLACGGKKEYLPTQHQLALFASDLYHYDVGDGDWICRWAHPNCNIQVKNFTRDVDNVTAFLAQSPGAASNWFHIWSNYEDEDNCCAYMRHFYADATHWNKSSRHASDRIAVCLGE